MVGFGSVVWVEVWMVYRSTFRWRLGQFLGGFESEFGSVDVLVVVAFFFFLGNFGGDGLVFVAKFWWKVVVWVFWRERERERDFSKYYLMCSLYYF